MTSYRSRPLKKLLLLHLLSPKLKGFSKDLGCPMPSTGQAFISHSLEL